MGKKTLSRLHPASMNELRQLVRLHGADRLIKEIRRMERETKRTQEVRVTERTSAERLLGLGADDVGEAIDFFAKYNR